MSDSHRHAPDAEPSSGDGAETETGGVQRREVVKMLALAPILGALGWSGVDVERAARMVRSLELAGAAQQYVPKFFTPEEWNTVNVLVDLIIPRDAKSGSATDAKVPQFIDFMLTDPEQNVSQANTNGWRNGLVWLNAESQKRFTVTFLRATDVQRRQILDDIAWPSRARPEFMEGVTFFNRARDMTAAGFFSSEIGWKDLDFMGNTAISQWNGCPRPALDKLGVSYDLMRTRIPVRNG
jgi:gluconate 2-dehydrogenase gamma chain